MSCSLTRPRSLGRLCTTRCASRWKAEISIRRADAAAKFPANFQLILAANPCPCGQASTRDGVCKCDPMKRRRYNERISGPVRDRIDIHHTVNPVSRAEMYQEVAEHGSTAAVAHRVLEARVRQRARFAGMPWLINADVPGFEFRRRCPLGSDVARPIEDAVAGGLLTQRGADRVARMAWSIADLMRRSAPNLRCVEEALHLRSNGLLGHSFGARRVA